MRVSIYVCLALLRYLRSLFNRTWLRKKKEEEEKYRRKVSLNSNNAQLEWNNRTLPDIIHCSLPIKETAGTSIFQNGRREVYTPLFFNRNTPLFIISPRAPR